MAGAGLKTFTAGAVLTAAEVNTYLMQQSVMVFGGTAARSSAIPTPSEGMVTYLSDLNDIQAYDGSSWISTGLTAGTTTANYGWPIPASGSIASLGTAIDTTVAGLGSGLKLISTQTLSASTGVSFTNVFDSATYTHYRLIFDLYASSRNTNLQFRCRINTTDVTAGYYSANVTVAYNNTLYYPFGTNNGAFMTLGTLATASSDNGKTLSSYDIYPASDNRFTMNGVVFDGYFAGAGISGGTLLTAQASAITGFTIYPAANNVTGTVALYGYQKA